MVGFNPTFEMFPWHSTVVSLLLVTIQWRRFLSLLQNNSTPFFQINNSHISEWYENPEIYSTHILNVPIQIYQIFIGTDEKEVTPDGALYLFTLSRTSC